MSESTSESTSESSYSDSEGCYTLTTTSDSGDEDSVETVDANCTTAPQNGSPVFRNWRPDSEKDLIMHVTPEHAEYLINPINTDTYKIKTKSGGKMAAARTWHPSSSWEESRVPSAGAQCLTLKRLRRLPAVRCATAAYNGARASRWLGWAIALAEAVARMAVAPVSAVASPFVSTGSMPMNLVDRALCKGLDVAEVLFSCIVMQPCQVCWIMKTCCANADLKDNGHNTAGLRV